MPVPLFDADDIPRPIMAALEPVAALRFPQQGKTSQVAIVESDRATWVVKRADEMPRHRMQPRALRELILDIGDHRLEHAFHRGVRRRLAEQFGIGLQQPPRLVIGRASQHHAVDMGKVRLRFGQIVLTGAL